MPSQSIAGFDPWQTPQRRWAHLPARTHGLLTVAVPGGPDVPRNNACARPARQLVPAGASLCAADPARWIGRGRQCADQRRAVRSGQSQGALGPQRHRKCLKPAAAPQQHPATRGALDTDGADAGRHSAFLSACVARDHRHACRQAEEQSTTSPARSPAGQLLHRHLPGMLERGRQRSRRFNGPRKPACRESGATG